MESDISALLSQGLQPVKWKAASNAEVENTSEETEDSESTGDFSTLLTSLLTPDGEKNVSEEALFAALTVERVTKLKGEEIGQKYGELLMSTEQSMTTNGRVAYEDAARVALNQMVTSGDLTAEEGDTVNTQAFSAAQLDSNINCLYDDVGSGTDITKAVSAVEAAINSAKSAMEKIDDGTDNPVVRLLSAAFDSFGNPLVNPYDTGAVLGTVGSTGKLASGSFSPNGTTMDGADGFLFKPIADGDGKLAILIPSTYTEWADKVTLKDSSGNVIEDGSWWSGHVPEPGEVGPQRKKFSFTQPGAAYPDGLTVEVTYNNGEKASYLIPDPAKRYD